MSDTRAAPPYAEEEATKWLAWLAHNMRRRDMTVFQIESLQPDWLANRNETILHLFLTRLLWGILSGLIVGLIVGPSVGLVAGLLVGVIGGFVDAIALARKSDANSRTRSNSMEKIPKKDIGEENREAMTLVKGSIIYGLITGLPTGVIYWLSYLHSDDTVSGILAGLIVGFVYGYIRTSRVTLRAAGEQIHTIESLKWSRQHMRYSGKKGATIGAPLGYFIGLMVLIIELLNKVQYDDIFWNLMGTMILPLIAVPFSALMYMIFGAIIGTLTGALIGGFQPATQYLKTQPNQGIWLTIRSAVKVSVLIGFVFSVLLGLISILLGSPLQNLRVGFLYGSVIFLIISLWYGGLDAMEHGIIRIIIARRDHAPLNYARFLDYAAEELNFLQKVGGGYVFIHRYLLEHFAEIAVEKGYVPVDDSD